LLTIDKTIKKKKKLKTQIKKKILMVGSIEYRKGSLNVALSLNYLPKNFQLLLVGKPQPIIGIPYLKKVLKLNRNRIHYLGYLQKSDYFSVLDKADIYIYQQVFLKRANLLLWMHC
jgi:glycosyltransferase involved in cell wall biosynthesis